MYCQKNKPAIEEVIEIVVSLRHVPAAIFAMSSPFVCLLSLLLITGAIQ